MGGLSYFTVRHFLLAGRESAAQHQAFNNALLVRTLAASRAPSRSSTWPCSPASTPGPTPTPSSTTAPRPTSRRSSVSASIPVQLRKDVLGGTAATQTYRTAAGDGRDRRRAPPSPPCTRSTSRCSTSPTSTTPCGCSALTLFVAGVVTTLLGTGLGRFASVRSLRPLADVSRAAGAIAGGRPRHPARPRGRRPRPRGLHPARSTPWSTSCRSASNAKRASTPTSATSCGPPSPPWPPPWRCWRPTGTSSRRVRRRPCNC